MKLNTKRIFLFLSILLSIPGICADKIVLPEIPESKKEMADIVYGNICRQAHYLISKVRNYHDNPEMRLLTDSRHEEHWIRPNTGTVLGFSFLYKFGEYDAGAVGVSREELLNEYIIPMMNYLVATYDTVPTDDGKCWNNQWQSAHWMYSLGKATWYLGDAIPSELRENVCRIVKAEASRFYNVEPPHQIKYDTKAEENAWNSQIFHVASLLMPEDKDYDRWQALFRKWVLSSYVTTKDIESGKVIDGFNLGTLAGANVFDDYTLENHGIIHPDYMSAFILSMQTIVDYKMTGREIPEFLLFNVREIYDNLKWFTLPDSGMTYPVWQDWRLFRNCDWLINHIYMAAYAGDRDAFYYAKESLECINLMQQRNPLGNIYSEDEYFFPSTQNDIILYLAQAWETLHFSENITDDYTPKKGVRHFQNGKILLNKSESFLHSLSYGNLIMFLPTLNAGDRLFDSYVGSGIGKIRLSDGDGKDLKVRLKEIHIDTTAKSYKVNLIVSHGDAVDASYQIKTYKNKLEVTEILTATRDCNIDRISTSEFGILNNAHWIRENGCRKVCYGHSSEICKALSGKVIELGKSNKFTVDNVVFKLDRKKGYSSRYATATKYEHARVTDVLSLNYCDKPVSCSKGEIISELHYTISLK